MLLQVENISKTFTSNGNDVQALDSVSLSIPEGKFVSIIGKSGSGKSTLLSLLGALDRPSYGVMIVDGQNLSKMNDRKLNIYRRNKIGYVFQNYNLVPNLSAVQNVMLPMEFAGVGHTTRKARAVKLLEQVGLTSEKHTRLPSRLSGGEQQRVAIARALANKPKIILADEPTGNLDSATGKLIFDLMHKLCRTNKTTIIVVTHDLSIAGKTDKTYTLLDGKLKTG